jgi:predicted house-cleaning noncanonical NTP pyrophosphatase (MazG superfamily)
LKAAPRNKLAVARDHTIEKRPDWQELKRQVIEGTHFERIVAKPTDPNLIRNREFTEELARFASEHKIVVELAGGVLSHAYYVLQRAGAQVECVDLFGADEDIVEYNKVVRDKIPDIIKGRGERVEVVRLSEDALLAGLRQKLVEEAYEALDANGGEELVAELADVQEVLNAIMGALEIKSQVERERSEKFKRRGGFDGGFMLRKTSTPHSLYASGTQPKDEGLSILPKIEMQQVIVNPREIPTSGPYRRPDLRTVGQETEKLFTIETEVNKVGRAMETVAFDLPLGGDEVRGFTLSLEFTRRGAVIRGSVRLRLQPKQMSFKVPDLQLKLNIGDDK